MGKAPVSNIPELVSRDRPLTWEAVEKVELDYAILNSHLEAKESALQEALSTISRLQQMVDDGFREAITVLPPEKRPQFTRYEEKAIFTVNTLATLRVSATKADVKVKIAERRFQREKAILEEDFNRKVQKLKDENFKTRAKFRAAQVVLQSNNLVLHESLIDAEMTPKARAENDELMKVKMLEGETATVRSISDEEIEQELQSESEITTDIDEESVSESGEINVKQPQVKTVPQVTEDGYIELNKGLIRVPLRKGNNNGVEDERIVEIPDSALQTSVQEISLTGPTPGVSSQSSDQAPKRASEQRIKGYTLDDLNVIEETDTEIFTQGTEDDEDSEMADGEVNTADLNAIAENEELLEMIELIGKNGWWRTQDFAYVKSFTFDKIRKNLVILQKAGLLRASMVRGIVANKVKIFELSEDGKAFYKGRFNKDAVESKLYGHIRDHANVEHALGIMQIADFFQSRDWNVETRRSRNIYESPLTRRLFAPDIVMHKEIDGVTQWRYVEFERGNGHDSAEFKEWVTRRIEWSSEDPENRRWYIYVPSQELVGKLQGTISEIYLNAYVKLRLDNQFNCSFIIRSVRKLETEGEKGKTNDLLPLGKQNPDAKWKRKPQSNS